MKNFLIVDGNSILNRAFYGIKSLSAKDGTPTNAVYGLVNILKRHIDTLKPDYAVIAFDVHAKTFRHKACDFYKANRKPMPEDLFIQLPIAKEAMKYMGFNVIELEGYEADDILGTCSDIATKNGDIHSYILTGDRDSLQLINDSTSVILAKTHEDIIYDREKFKEDFGVTPEQYVDVKSIMGDSSDNIPGIKGIGEKSAFVIINEFGSLANLYENYQSSASLTPSQKKKIEDGKDMAYTSRFLATIVKDAPINSGVSDFVFRGTDGENLSKLFTKLEFGSLLKKFALSPTKIEKEEKNSDFSYPTNFDFSEISSLDSLENGLYAVYFSDEKIYICSEKSSYLYHGKNYSDFLKNNSIICHDLKSVDFNENVNCVFDTMLAGYVLSPADSSYSLTDLCQKYLSEEFDVNRPAEFIYMLYCVLNKQLEEAETKKILTDIEIPLAKVLSSMEKDGFRIDIDAIKDFGEKINNMADIRKERIFSLAGEEFNVNSPKQLGEILFEKLGLPHGKKTKTGYSTNAEILEELRSDYPIISEILEYRQLTKLSSTYCEGLLKVADEYGIIHTTFNQTVTVTGRLSSTEPNLQNIPIRTELGSYLRKCFITKKKNYVLIDADYSQIELKVLAHLSKDANMIYAFNSGEDIHTATASKVFGVPSSDVTPDMRKRAKAVNFGIIYGIGEFSLSKDLHITRKEAKDYITSYFEMFPDIYGYIHSLVDNAKRDGFTKTMFGRKRYIPELASKNGQIRAFGERIAMNSPIQGSAADIIKIAMINVHSAIKKAKLDAKLILQVHDELIIEANKSCANEVEKILKREMENAVELRVKLTAETGVGKNWLEAKQ